MPSHPQMLVSGGAAFEASPRRRSSIAAGIVHNFGRSRPVVEIELEGGQLGVPVYTTLDRIQGTVSFTAPTDTAFSDVHITFQGTTRTFVEKVATTAQINPRTQAIHNFLRLIQPIEPSDLPEDRVAKAGVTYKFPFTFVVPERLLPQSCTHQKNNSRVYDAHLVLPPSLGDAIMAVEGRGLLEDMSPDMAIVSYALRVMITRKADSGKASILVDSIKKLRIAPAIEEAPPLPISAATHDDPDYTLSKSRTLKKGLFKGKLGVLTASAEQPHSLRLPQLRAGPDAPPTNTMVLINLRFDPADASAKPPRLGQLWNRLKVATFFSCLPMRDIPRRTSAYMSDTQRGLYVDTIPLSSRCVESAQWTVHKRSASPRRDSAISIRDDDSSPASSDDAAAATAESTDNSTSPIYYTSQIIAPVELPRGSKVFVPTFHTCLVSRVYTLDFTLSAHAGRTGSSVSGTTTLHLKIPLQISADADPNARPTISAEEAAAIAARELDFETSDNFLPRSVAPPSPEYTENAQLVRQSAAAAADDPDLGQPSPNYEERAAYSTLGARRPYASVSGTAGEPVVRAPPRSDAPPGYSAFGDRGVGVSFGMGRSR